MTIRVRLKPNDESGDPEQFGELCYEDPEPQNGTLLVLLDKQYWQPDERDGLREVPENQVEVVK